MGNQSLDLSLYSVLINPCNNEKSFIYVPSAELLLWRSLLRLKLLLGVARNLCRKSKCDFLQLFFFVVFICLRATVASLIVSVCNQTQTQSVRDASRATFRIIPWNATFPSFSLSSWSAPGKSRAAKKKKKTNPGYSRLQDAAVIEDEIRRDELEPGLFRLERQPDHSFITCGEKEAERSAWSISTGNDQLRL